MSSSDSSSDGGWGYSNRYSPSSSSSSSYNYRAAPSYNRYVESSSSSSSEDEDENLGNREGYSGEYSGEYGGGYETTDENQHDALAPGADAPDHEDSAPGEPKLNTDANDSCDAPDLRDEVAAPVFPSLPEEQNDEPVPGDQGPKWDIPTCSDSLSIAHGSNNELEPGETPLTAVDDETCSGFPHLEPPGLVPGHQSNLEDMPQFEDSSDELPPDISIPERGHDGSTGDRDDDSSHSEHGSNDLETPDGEWIGLDPTLGEHAQRQWSKPNAKLRKRKHIRCKKTLLVSRWGVHLRRDVPTSRADVSITVKGSPAIISNRNPGKPSMTVEGSATGQGASTAAYQGLETVAASLARPFKVRQLAHARFSVQMDTSRVLASLSEQKLLADGTVLAERAERETILQPAYTFNHTEGLNQRTTPVYEPLLGDTCFRILHLIPSADPTSPIACRLTIEDLTDSKVQYEAVSYTWGAPRPSYNITCNGNTLDIGPSLHSLLTRLRLTNQPRALWADAICIDQGNDAEKGHQVRLMQRIYQTAARVVVWLGEEPLEPGQGALKSAACKALCRMAGAWSHALHNNMPKPGYKVGGRQYRLSAREMRDVAPEERREWASLRALFRKQYWERLWVVQEVTSSSTAVVQWGDVEIPWTWVGIAACLIRHNHDKSTSMIDDADLRGVHNACLMFLLPDEEWASTPFLHLMRVLLRFQVTNQHDRAYAILGLPGLHTGGATASLFVQPDYGLSLQELYVALAERIVNTHENPLDLLSAVKHDHNIDLSLPSWVPRWNVTFVRSINGSHRAGMRFHAGGTSPPQTRPSCHRRATDGRLVLKAQGRIIATVAKAAAPPTSPLAEATGLANGWGSAARLLFEWRWIGPNEVDMEESTMRAICMTITAGQDWYGRLINTDEADRQHLADFGAFCSSIWKRRWSRAPIAENLPCAERFALAVRNVCQQRKIFQTQYGALGIGSTATRAGDVICVLQGGSVPYVLRPALDKSDIEEYLLVGECYLHGYMFGEALEQHALEETDAVWDMITLL